MTLMSRVQRGRTPKPPRLLVYGTEGIGKSTFAAGAPSPVFIQTEDGLDEIVCDKFPLATTFDDVIGALAELRTEKHEYETVVIDSLDWLERMIWDRVCQESGVKSIEKADGGFAKGYTHALTFWREVVDQLNALRAGRGMVVLLIAHAKVEKFEDPEAPPYDRYSPRLHKHAAALISEWCDAVLFATRKFRTASEEAVNSSLLLCRSSPIHQLAEVVRFMCGKQVDDDAANGRSKVVERNRWSSVKIVSMFSTNGRINNFMAKCQAFDQLGLGGIQTRIGGGL